MTQAYGSAAVYQRVEEDIADSNVNLPSVVLAAALPLGQTGAGASGS